MERRTLEGEEVQALGSDRDALGALLVEEAGMLKRVVAGKIPPKYQRDLPVDDVLAEVFLQAVRSIGTCKATTRQSFRGWLVAISTTCVIDTIRGLEADKRRPPGDCLGGQPGASPAAFMEALAGTSSTPSRAARRNEAAAALQEAMDHLPDEYRTVVQQRDIEGRPVEEVATTLGRSKGAVWMLRIRAHDRLREMLGSWGRFRSTT